MFWTGPDIEQQAAAGQSPLVFGQVGSPWDPAEELAYLLQDSMPHSMPPRQAESFERVVFDETTDTLGSANMATGAASVPGPTGAVGPAGVVGPPSVVGLAPTQASGGHRHAASKSPSGTLLRTGSLFTALLVAVIAAVVSVFSGLAICDALRHSATPRTTHDVVSWWPLLIYGPWMVASLSILRAALHQRRAVHSWSIVLLFSTLATFLCVAQAPRTLAAQAAAMLPAIAALACFQQLVRQITLTRPPRNPMPRHRNRMPSPSPSPGPTFHYGA
ncbi:hypothetical protein [Streptomyces sp. BR123]|uniref:hypothetical protein n=1 Tax=Streptomyces sp. BR123 TaxID=2749828 RepID=UPI00211AF405|nr:hypothetical protein [Streptomyces sp. BR123]